jgi:hypothetical protein
MKLPAIARTGRQLTAWSRLFSCLLMSTLVGSTSVAEAQLSAAVEMSQSSYVFGERIEMAVTAFNGADEDVTLQFTSSFQAQVVLDDEPLNSIGSAALTLTWVTIPARGSIDWRFDSTQSLDVGVHQVRGFIAPRRSADSSWPVNILYDDVVLFDEITPYSLSGPGFFTLPDFFEITEPEPVIDDVFIDFETYPNGSSTRGPHGTRGIWQDAYAEWGVQLNTTGYATSSLGMNLEDRFSSDNVVLGTNLSKRDIRAEFEMPVFEVSSAVGTAQGRSVTMTIFDEQGNILDSITSSDVSDYPALLDPVALTSEVPIASVQWSSSDPLASVIIDDLFLDVRSIPEPSGVALIATFLMSFMPRRRSYRLLGPHVSGSP